MTQNVQYTDSQKDVESISSVIASYVEGGRKGDASIMMPAFHKNATIHGIVNGSLFGGPIQILFDWVKDNSPATKLEAEIVNIDVANTVATARVELSNWNDARYTDQFTLLKENDVWTITSKVFHLYKNEKRNGQRG